MKSPRELTIDLSAVGMAGAATTALAYRAEQPAAATLILGHGAGAGQRSAFMVDWAGALAALGLDVLTFNFLYVEQRRKIPDRAPLLEACYRAAIATAMREIESASRRLCIGGKSMGGRIATQVAAADPGMPIAGLVLLGYPLHPPGKPEQLRDRHLPAVQRPMLFVQGRRDAFGTPEELVPILARCTPAPTLHPVDGDHSFTVSKKGEQAGVDAGIQRTVRGWIESLKSQGSSLNSITRPLRVNPYRS